MRGLEAEEVLVGTREPAQVGAVEFDAVHAVGATAGVVEVDAVVVVDKDRRVEYAPVLAAAASGVQVALEPMAVLVDEVAEELEGAQRMTAAKQPGVVAGQVYVALVGEGRGRRDTAAFRNGYQVVLPAHQVFGRPNGRPEASAGRDSAGQIQVVFRSKPDDCGIGQPSGVLHDERVDVAQPLLRRDSGCTVPAVLHPGSVGCDPAKHCRDGQYCYSTVHDAFHDSKLPKR